MRMRNPCHPGRILRECMGDMTVTAFAKQIEITYVDLTDILHGKRSISSEVAQKLGQAFPNQDAALWLRLQSSYDRAHDAEFERTVE
jgi:addiction module HigA family antidote